MALHLGDGSEIEKEKDYPWLRILNVLIRLSLCFSH